MRHSLAMMRVAATVLVASACLGACTGGATGSSAKECGPAQIEDNRRLLVGTCTEPSVADVRPLATARWAPVAELEPDGFQVRITPDGVGLASDPTPWDEAEFRRALVEELGKSRQMAEAWGKPFEPRFVLAIHREATLGRIVPVLRALVAEHIDRGFLVFASGTRARSSPARHPEIYERCVAELESVAPTERSAFMAQKMKVFAAQCPALEVAFANTATVPVDSRCATLMAAAAEAIVTCGCPEYEPELVSWLQVFVGPVDAAPLHVDAIGLAPAKVIDANADTTWDAFVAEQHAPLSALGLALAP